MEIPATTFSEHDPIARIVGRLLAAPPAAPERLVPDWEPPVPPERPPVSAAVLIALVRREGHYSVLYTERAAHLKAHSGQISFPGGKIDPEDAGAEAAALREAEEEVAMQREDARVLGYLPAYYSGNNFLITPVVAVVEPRTAFVPNPREVASVFEVPLPVLMAEDSYGTFRIELGGGMRTSWQIAHEGRTIWGITANLTRRFYEMALRGEDG